MTEATPPKGMITAKDYGIRKNHTEDQVIHMIKEGERVGRKVGDEWFVEEIQGSTTKEKTNPNKYQPDLDKAQKAASVGSTLSGISTFVHVLLVIVFFASNGKPQYYEEIILVFGVCAGLLISWAIIHALLSIVVTNALTAKYTIYQATETPRRK